MILLLNTARLRGEMGSRGKLYKCVLLDDI